MSMDTMDKVVRGIEVDMYNLAKNFGGWTMDIHRILNPDHGYAVGGILPEWIFPGWKNVPGPAVIQMIRDYIINIDNSGESVSGGWVRDDGTLVLDCSTVIESRSQAVALGRERGEQAIYCLHTGETIEL